MRIDLLITSKQKNLESWNLDSTWELVTASYVPISGILGYVVENWHTNKHKKLRILASNFVNSTTTQKPLGMQSWNLRTMWVLMIGLRKPSLGAPGYVTKMLQVENWQKVLNRYISVNINIDGKWFGIFEHTINHLSFGYVRLPQPEYYFSRFFLFSYFFILLPLSTFKLLNALYWKLERLKISGRTSMEIKGGGGRLGTAPAIGSSKILNF